MRTTPAREEERSRASRWIETAPKWPGNGLRADNRAAHNIFACGVMHTQDPSFISFDDYARTRFGVDISGPVKVIAIRPWLSGAKRGPAGRIRIQLKRLKQQPEKNHEPHALEKTMSLSCHFHIDIHNAHGFGRQFG
jgi:hypothetical protein